MSYKMLAAALAATALVLPTVAVAQDASPRTEIIITGAVSADKVDQIDDESAVEAAELPVVYEDAPEAADEAETAAEDSAAADPNLSEAVETQ